MQVGCGESWGDRIGGQGMEDIPDVADDGDDQVETEGLAAFVVERPKAVHGDDGAACVVCLKCSSQGTAALGARVVGTGDGSGDGTPERDRAGTDEGGTDVAAPPQMWTAGEMMMHPDRLLGALEVVSRSATALGVERSLAIHQAIVAGDTMHPKVAQMVRNAREASIVSAEAWKTTLQMSAVSVCARSVVQIAIASVCPTYRPPTPPSVVTAPPSASHSGYSGGSVTSTHSVSPLGFLGKWDEEGEEDEEDEEGETDDAGSGGDVEDKGENKIVEDIERGHGGSQSAVEHITSTAETKETEQRATEEKGGEKTDVGVMNATTTCDTTDSTKNEYDASGMSSRARRLSSDMNNVASASPASDLLAVREEEHDTGGRAITANIKETATPSRGEPNDGEATTTTASPSLGVNLDSRKSDAKAKQREKKAQRRRIMAAVGAERKRHADNAADIQKVFKDAANMARDELQKQTERAEKAEKEWKELKVKLISAKSDTLQQVGYKGAEAEAALAAKKIADQQRKISGQAMELKGQEMAIDKLNKRIGEILHEVEMEKAVVATKTMDQIIKDRDKQTAMTLMQEELDASNAFVSKFEEKQLVRCASKRTAKTLGRLLKALYDQRTLRLNVARPWEHATKAANIFSTNTGRAKSGKGKSAKWVALQEKCWRWVRSILVLRRAGEIQTHEEKEREEEKKEREEEARIQKEADDAAAVQAAIEAEKREKRDGWKRTLGDVGMNFYSRPSDVPPPDQVDDYVRPLPLLGDTAIYLLNDPLGTIVLRARIVPSWVVYEEDAPEDNNAGDVAAAAAAAAVEVVEASAEAAAVSVKQTQEEERQSSQSNIIPALESWHTDFKQNLVDEGRIRRTNTDKWRSVAGGEALRVAVERQGDEEDAVCPSIAAKSEPRSKPNPVIKMVTVSTQTMPQKKKGKKKLPHPLSTTQEQPLREAVAKKNSARGIADTRKGTPAASGGGSHSRMPSSPHSQSGHGSGKGRGHQRGHERGVHMQIGAIAQASASSAGSSDLPVIADAQRQTVAPSQRVQSPKAPAVKAGGVFGMLVSSSQSAHSAQPPSTPSAHSPSRHGARRLVEVGKSDWTMTMTQIDAGDALKDEDGKRGDKGEEDSSTRAAACTVERLRKKDDARNEAALQDLPLGSPLPLLKDVLELERMRGGSGLPGLGGGMAAMTPYVFREGHNVVSRGRADAQQQVDLCRLDLLARNAEQDTVIISPLQLAASGDDEDGGDGGYQSGGEGEVLGALGVLVADLHVKARQFIASEQRKLEADSSNTNNRDHDGSRIAAVEGPGGAVRGGTRRCKQTPPPGINATNNLYLHLVAVPAAAPSVQYVAAVDGKGKRGGADRGGTSRQNDHHTFLRTLPSPSVAAKDRAWLIPTIRDFLRRFALHAERVFATGVLNVGVGTAEGDATVLDNIGQAVSLLQSQHHRYKRRGSRTDRLVDVRTPSIAASGNTSPTTSRFPLDLSRFIEGHILSQVGVRSLVGRRVWELLSTVGAHVRSDPEVALFADMLEGARAPRVVLRVMYLTVLLERTARGEVAKGRDHGAVLHTSGDTGGRSPMTGTGNVPLSASAPQASAWVGTATATAATTTAIGGTTELPKQQRWQQPRRPPPPVPAGCVSLSTALKFAERALLLRHTPDSGMFDGEDSVTAVAAVAAARKQRATAAAQGSDTFRTLSDQWQRFPDESEYRTVCDRLVLLGSKRQLEKVGRVALRPRRGKGGQSKSMRNVTESKRGGVKKEFGSATKKATTGGRGGGTELEEHRPGTSPQTVAAPHYTMMRDESAANLDSFMVPIALVTDEVDAALHRRDVTRYRHAVLEHALRPKAAKGEVTLPDFEAALCGLTQEAAAGTPSSPDGDGEEERGDEGHLFSEHRGLGFQPLAAREVRQHFEKEVRRSGLKKLRLPLSLAVDLANRLLVHGTAGTTDPSMSHADNYTDSGGSGSGGDSSEMRGGAGGLFWGAGGGDGGVSSLALGGVVEGSNDLMDAFLFGSPHHDQMMAESKRLRILQTVGRHWTGLRHWMEGVSQHLLQSDNPASVCRARILYRLIGSLSETLHSVSSVYSKPRSRGVQSHLCEEGGEGGKGGKDGGTGDDGNSRGDGDAAKAGALIAKLNAENEAAGKAMAAATASAMEGGEQQVAELQQKLEMIAQEHSAAIDAAQQEAETIEAANNDEAVESQMNVAQKLMDSLNQCPANNVSVAHTPPVDPRALRAATLYCEMFRVLLDTGHIPAVNAASGMELSVPAAVAEEDKGGNDNTDERGSTASLAEIAREETEGHRVEEVQEQKGREEKTAGKVASCALYNPHRLLAIFDRGLTSLEYTLRMHFEAQVRFERDGQDAATIGIMGRGEEPLSSQSEVSRMRPWTPE